MDREQFAERVHDLRQEGKSIRAIARELGTYKTKIQRALKDQAEHPSYGAPTRNVAAGAFVGRKPEMDVLRAALEDVVSGWPRIVMLSGEPGIGKTRLAQEIGIVAADSSVQTLWGRCYEGQGAPSYWPWVQIVRDYVRGRDVKQLRSDMGAGAANIAEIVSELRAKLPGLESPTPLDSPDANRFRLFDSIASFFKNAARSKPVMLVLEDLHWADRPSLMLLEFLAHEMSGSRILVVGTFRHTESEHVLSQTIGELAREPYFQQIQLSRLGLSDVGRYIEETSGARAPDEYTRAIYSRTEGNPFFMTELVRLLGHGPSNTAQGQGFDVDVSMPDSVRGAIRRRFEGLSRTCNQALTIASVIGREFGLDLVSSLLPDVSSDQLLMELEEATRLRIVDEVDGEVGRYQFSHVLIQEALSDELSGPRKAASHAEIGKALEALYEGELEAHAAELAHHFAEAAPGTSIDKLVRYSLMAGERALATYAYEDAQAHFERGLAVKEGQRMDDETAALLFALGRAHVATQQPNEARSNFYRAFDYYAEVRNVPEVASIVRALPPGGGLLGMTRLTAGALDLVPSDSLHAARFLSRHGLDLGRTDGDYEAAQEAFRRALSIARRENDSALEMRTLANAADVDVYHLHIQDAADRSLKVIELSQYADDPYSEALARRRATVVFMRTGDSNAASQHAAAGLAISERLRDRYRLRNALLTCQGFACLKGDWEAACKFSDRALALGALVVARDDASLLAARALLEHERGEFTQGEAHLGQLLEVMRLFKPGPTMEGITSAISIVMIARNTGRWSKVVETAEASATTVLSSPHVTPLQAEGARATLALIAVHEGDVTAAAEQHGALESHRGVMLPYFTISSDRLLGLLAQTMSKHDDAAIHFEDALAFCRKAGYRPELAWTCYEYADLRQALGEYKMALALLDEALAISTELGMSPLLKKVMALKEDSGSQSTATPRYPADLTPREVEVLLLIAQGKTTREIANELVLSPRTVQRHTTNLYAKINVRNRAEATAFALNELTPSIQNSSRS